jgi:hypothetical protein
MRVFIIRVSQGLIRIGEYFPNSHFKKIILASFPKILLRVF